MHDMQALATTIRALALPIESAQFSSKAPANDRAHNRPLALGRLVLNTKGEVISCSAALAQHAGEAASDLTGRGVRTLLPGLPFRAATEGYNVAFGSFLAACRQLQSWALKRSDGSRVQVTGALSMRRCDAGYSMLLDLYDPDGGGVSCLPLSVAAHHAATPARDTIFSAARAGHVSHLRSVLRT